MDYGHKVSDKELAKLERRLAKEYETAEKEVREKLFKYLQDFKRKDAEKKAQVKAGLMSETEYNNWRVNQMIIGKRWESMRNVLAEDFHNANNIAKEMIKEHSYDIYALNHNYGTYEVEMSSGIDTSYTLYSRETVERLVRDNPDMLPPPGKKVSERIKAGLDVRWNNQQIQSVMMQGILQGMSIPELSKRLAETVGDRNMTSAIRNARTMTTGAQNAGRVDSYQRAKDMGIELKQMWIATLDGRTRDSHRHLDGEMVEVGETFSNGCRFPGDPQGRPEEVYNCRCTLIAKFRGVQYTFAERSTTKEEYEEWKKGKEPAEKVKEPKKEEPKKEENERILITQQLPMVDDAKKYYENELGVSEEDAEKIDESLKDYFELAYSYMHDLHNPQNEAFLQSENPQYMNSLLNDYETRGDRYKAEVDIIDNMLNNPNMPIYNGTIYRGLMIGDDTEDVQNPLTYEQKINVILESGEWKEPGISSFSSNKTIANNFAGINKEDTELNDYFSIDNKEYCHILLKCEDNKSGAAVSHLSRYAEDEVLIPSDVAQEGWKIIDYTIETNYDGRKTYIINISEK